MTSILCGSKPMQIVGPSLFYRSSGTASLKFKNAEGTIPSVRKAGIDGFRQINDWYTQLGGWGLSEISSRRISPTAVTETKIIQAIESYESDYKEYI